MAYVAWKLYRNEYRYYELEYMGYKADLSAYQLKKLKRYINELPEIYDGFESLTKAESILHYTKDGKEFYCQPSGILSFKRGRHPHELICDDVLRDPETKLSTEIIGKITRTFDEEIMQMPSHALHVLGTPQDETDLFGKLRDDPNFDAKEYPAVLSFKDKTVLWKEHWDYDRLMERKKSIGDKAFSKEFMCKPVRGLEGYFTREQLDERINKRLKNYAHTQKPRLHEYTYAGFDIGKKTHPSHFAVFGVNRKGQLKQIHSKWMDGWDYCDQLEYLEEAIENFNIDACFYDNTRAEFEAFRERGELPDGMFGLVFTAKNKFAMATEFDSMVTSKQIELLDDGRQKRQLLNVDNDLKAVETAEGHGDSFFSICLAITAYKKGQGTLAWNL